MLLKGYSLLPGVKVDITATLTMQAYIITFLLQLHDNLRRTLGLLILHPYTGKGTVVLTTALGREMYQVYIIIRCVAVNLTDAVRLTTTDNLYIGRNTAKGMGVVIIAKRLLVQQIIECLALAEGILLSYQMDVEQEITAVLHVTSLDFILSMVEVILQQVELVILNGISLLIVEHAANALGSDITGRKENSFIGKTLEILLTTLDVIQTTAIAPVNVILLAELVTGRLAVLIIIPGIEHDSFKNLKHLRLHQPIGTLRRSGCQGSTVLKVGERIGLTSSRNLLNILRNSYLLLLSRVIVHLVRHTCIYDGTKEVGIDTQTYQCLLTVFLIIETLTGDTIERIQEVALLSKNLRLIHVIKAVNGRINLLTQILIRHSGPLFNQMTDGIQRKVGMPVDTIVIQSLTGLSSLSFLLTIAVGMVILLIGKGIELLTDAVRQRGRVDLTVHLGKTLAGSEDNLVVLMNHIAVSVLGSLGFKPLLVVNTRLLQVHYILDPFLGLLTGRESSLSLRSTDHVITTPGSAMNVATLTPATGIGSLAHLGEADKTQHLTVKGNLMVTAFLINPIDRLLLLGKSLNSLIKAGLDLLIKFL